MEKENVLSEDVFSEDVVSEDVHVASAGALPWLGAKAMAERVL